MNNKMKRGLFGRKNGALGVMPGDQPDFGMGDVQFPQRKGPFDTAPGQAFPQQVAPKQGFMSKLPGTMADIGSILDDDDNGRSMAYRQDRVYQEQQAQAKAQAAQQAAMEKREYDRDDYMFKQQYERDNPKPANNDTVNDIEFMRSEVAAGKMTPQQYNTWYENNILAPKYFTGKDGLPYQQGGIPSGPVGKLTPIGGGAGNGVGSFRP